MKLVSLTIRKLGDLLEFTIVQSDDQGVLHRFGTWVKDGETFDILKFYNDIYPDQKLKLLD